MDKNCGNCVYAEPIDTKGLGPFIGHCVRFPPVLDTDRDYPVASSKGWCFPVIDFVWHCGEFKGKGVDCGTDTNKP